MEFITSVTERNIQISAGDGGFRYYSFDFRLRAGRRSVRLPEYFVEDGFLCTAGPLEPKRTRKK